MQLLKKLSEKTSQYFHNKRVKKKKKVTGQALATNLETRILGCVAYLPL